MKPIRKILIANRGEIACRIIRTCREMHINTVLVYSEADREIAIRSEADEYILLPGNYPSETYLDQDKIIAAAKRSGADAIHPGYGFLSENYEFASRCLNEGLIFVGPHPEAIFSMGDKARAKDIARANGVPVIPGYEGKDQSIERIMTEAARIGYPVLLKASAGGGGKGMKRVEKESDLLQALESARSEAKASFGNDTLLIEKYFDECRHIEIQIFGDKHRNVVHLYERECSIQRRHQKIIEESPSPVMTEELRQRMTSAAISLAHSIRYDSAGTVECIVDRDFNFYFLEVNTRLQVEHPVTEMITDIDLVEWQIRVAQGEPIPLRQEEIIRYGHALQARVYAEDATHNFLPSIGSIRTFRPLDSGARWECAIQSGDEISRYYDPMIAKVIQWGESREEAIRGLDRELSGLFLSGLTTNLAFLHRILRHDSFLRGETYTNFVSVHPELFEFDITPQAIAELTAAVALVQSFAEYKSDPNYRVPFAWRNNPYGMLSRKVKFGKVTYTVNYSIVERKPWCIGLEVEVDTFRFPCEVEILDGDMPLLAYFSLNGHGVKVSLDWDRDRTVATILHPLYGLHTAILPDRLPIPEKKLEKGAYRSPMPGEVVRILVKEGDYVKAGDTLLVLSSMKMESAIEAFEEGIVHEIPVGVKQFVQAETELIIIKTNKIEK